MKSKSFQKILAVIMIFCAFGFSSQAKAQDLQTILATGCTIGSYVGDNWKWICRLTSIYNTVQYWVTNAEKEGTSFLQNLGGDLLKNGLQYLGSKVDTSEISNILNQVDKTISSAPYMFENEISRLATEALKNGIDAIIGQTNPFPTNSVLAHQWDLVRVNPIVTNQQLHDKLTQSQNFEAAAQAVGAVKQSKDGFAKLAGDDTAEKLQLDMSIDEGPLKGVAPKLIEDSNTAVSTRSAVQTMTRGIASMISENAATNANVVGAIKAQVQQQALTTQELGIIASDVVAKSQEEAGSFDLALTEMTGHAEDKGNEIQVQTQTLGELILKTKDTSAMSPNW